MNKAMARAYSKAAAERERKVKELIVAAETVLTITHGLTLDSATNEALSDLYQAVQTAKGAIGQ